MVASVDVPHLRDYHPPSLREYETLTFGGGSFLPEAFFLARRDTEYVGMSFLECVPGDRGSLHQILHGYLARVPSPGGSRPS